MTSPSTILVVDDSPTQLELMRHLLQSHGYRTLGAGNGAQTLAALDQGQVDMVLLDVVLPDADGHTLCRQIRARADAAALPVVLLTARSTAGERIAGLEAGADDFLAKPVDGEELLARVRSLLRIRALNRQLSDALQQSSESEKLFRGILESAADGIVISDAQGRIVIVNTQAEAMFGYSRQQMLGQTVEMLIPERLRAGHVGLRGDYYREPRARKMGASRNIVARRHDGSEFPADISLSTLATASGLLVTVAVRDISDRMQAESEMRRANRTLRMLSPCNQAVVRAQSEPELLEAVCRHIVEIGGYRFAWVGYGVNDAQRSIRVAEHAGSDRDFVDAFGLTWGDDDPGRRGMGGTAIAEGRTVVVRDITTDPLYARWRDEALARGLRSCIALPLRGKTATMGTLSIYAAEPEAFDDEEIGLLQELAGDLGYGIRSLRETEAREQFERELEYQTHYDLLTGLPNRTLFIDRLRQSLLHSSRAGRIAAVLAVDLDRFKLVNDSLGQEAGDALLKHVAQELAAGLRDGDTVARLSADEFAVVMSDVAAVDDVTPVARRLLEAASQPLVLGERTIRSSASIGIALSPRDGEDAEDLFRNAKAAMHHAKSLGGNALRYYAPEMNEHLSARLALELDLRRAIERDELSLHYQGRISLRSGQLVGAEALLRWRHPERGMVPPAEFIPLAEESGFILPLGDWVIDSACRQIRRWLDAGLTVPRVSINLSAHQFRQEDLAASIRRALDASGVDAQHLELEITEGTAMQDLQGTQATLRQLKALGIKLSLDDFGTGYSSLAYLKRLPIDHLKIDRAFVRDISTDPDDAAICNAVIGLAHTLGLVVVAEGVETEAQMNFLRRQGCDDVQGYYFGRPQPADEFAALLGGWQVPAFAAEGAERTILLVDDEPNVLSSLRRALRREGYRILTANSAQEGFDVLATQEVQVILSDQRMPGMNGTEFLSRVRDLYPDTVRIVLSGYTELNSVTEAVNRGAIYRFLTKPWDDELLRAHLQEAFRFQAMNKRAR